MNIANKISTFRILTVPFFMGCLIYYTPDKDFLRFIALVIFTLGVISDGIDGYIARKSKQQSKAGLVLDPLGDKLLLMGAFIVLSPMSKLPVYFPLWLTLIVISRDAIILLGAVVLFIVKQNINIMPTRWGKLTTTFQMLSVLTILLQWQFAFVLWYVVAVLTGISGMDYITRGFKILYAVDNNRNHH